jgi:hypothetical protein
LAPVLGSREPLDVERLIYEARAATGLEDFGGEAFRAPLARLVDALESEAAMSPLGDVITKSRIHGHLVNRLRLAADDSKIPDVTDEKIRAPIAIAGPPRTGTSILFHLIAQDPSRLSPLAWKLQYPSPPPGRSAGPWDRRVLAQKGREHFLYAVLPALRQVYRTAADLPEECVVMKGHEFTTIMFSIAYRVPSYEAWLLDADHTSAYRMHRRFLQQLQYEVDDPAWILKSPEHLLSLDAFLATYPDACIVQTHRDPLEVLPSLASLTQILRSLSSEQIDPQEIGRDTAHFWSTALDRARRFRETNPALKDRFIDVEFEDICDDPIAVVGRIYDHFGFELSDEARRCMTAFLAKNPRGRFGEHRYSLESYGFDREREADRFVDYRTALGYART